MELKNGSVEVVCGSMFSGKTEEMIRRLRRAVIARQKVQVFKPVIDTRYNATKVTSHAGVDFEAIPIEKSTEVMKLLKSDTTVIGIDEAQFFDEGIVKVIEESGRQRYARDRDRFGHGFSRRTFWLHARTHGSRGQGG